MNNDKQNQATPALAVAPCSADIRTMAERERKSINAKKVYRNQLTAQLAKNSGAQWSERELKIALDRNFSIREAALKTGRTYASVQNKRHRVKYFPPNRKDQPRDL